MGKLMFTFRICIAQEQRSSRPGYIVFVNGLCSNIHAADFPLPCCSHKKGNPYCLLAIKLAELLCFRFRLTSSAQILEGDEKI
ncbi:hypothetical protein YC2023_060176 [Brassica napus]